jgi:hypothetical protein
MYHSLIWPGECDRMRAAERAAVRVERVARAMYETPVEEGDTSTWPPSHPDDRAMWINLATAAIKELA